MSLLDENIEIPFEALLESLDWYKTEQLNGSYSYTYSRMDCANRYFIIEFFPIGEDPDNAIYVNDVNELRIAIEAIKNKHKV